MDRLEETINIGIVANVNNHIKIEPKPTKKEQNSGDNHEHRTNKKTTYRT